MSQALALQPLKREAFAPFGEVIEMEGQHQFGINQGATQRFHDTARIFGDPASGYPSISLARSQPLPSPLAIRVLERHPLGSQAFIPLERRPFIVVVAPPGDEIDSADVRAFVSNGRQGVSYRPGIWHHSLLALSVDQEFIIVDLITDQPNCDEHRFSTEKVLTLDYSALLV